MKNEPHLPIPADEDPDLESQLGDLGRFSPRRGFEDRVVTRVRVPFPRWLRGLRDRTRALLSGVRGWTILAAFSTATAAAWGSMIVAGVRHRGAVTAATGLSLSDVTGWIRDRASEFVLVPAMQALGELKAALAAAGISLPGLAIGYGAVVLVSVVALWRLMAEPTRAKGAIDA
jgi:hypothetical protein